MLSSEDKTAYDKLSATDRQRVTVEQVQRVRVAINDGSLDKASANDALERIDALAKHDPNASATPDRPYLASSPQPSAPLPNVASPSTQPNPSPAV